MEPIMQKTLFAAACAAALAAASAALAADTTPTTASQPAAANTTTTTASTTPTVTVTGQKQDPNAQVCAYESHEGSMIKRRVCMSRAEADARRHYTQDQLSNYQVRELSMPMAK